MSLGATSPWFLDTSRDGDATQSLGSIAGSLTAGFIYSVHVKLPFICTFVVYGLGVLAAAAYIGVKKRK